MTTDSRIAIVGGGPGGLMLARLLQLRGIQATVFERDANADDRPQGGSLDLHSDTGQRAIRIAGLETAFIAEARTEDQGDRLYDQDGRLLFDRDGEGDNRPEIDRAALRRILLDSLVPGTVHWSSKVESVTADEDGRHAVTVGGLTQSFDIVVGADGAWSRVRPLVSDAAPVYEGVVLVELGFDARRDRSVNALVGGGKMFAIGDNRVLIAQRNGHGHIRGYAGQRLSEDVAQEMAAFTHDLIRASLLEAFAGWAPMLLHMIESGDVIAVRPLYALPIGHGWASRPAITLLGDAAHVMSPFGGEGVNLALSDAADLADALTSGEGWPAVARYEAVMVARAKPAATGAAEGLNSAISSAGVGNVLEHYRARVTG